MTAIGRTRGGLGLWCALALVAGASDRASASPLSELVETMSPGDWAELETTGLTDAISETLGIGATGSIFPYSEDGVWDGTSGRLYFIGSDHIYDGTSSGARFVAFDEDSNGWSILPSPPWMGMGTMHGYDHSAILDGRLYHMTLTRGDPLRQYDIASSTWTDRAVFDHGSYNHYGALEPFPALGGLVYVEAGGVYLWEEESNAWSVIATDVPMGDYHNFAESNPVHDLVIFGGGNGSGAIHVLHADRTITEGSPASFPLRVNEAIVTVDPLSGEYLVFGGSGEFHTYDATTDEWRVQEGHVPLFDGGGDEPVGLTIAGPVDSYGVVIFVEHTGIGDSPNANVWIYKHSPGEGPGRPDAGPPVDGGVDGDADADGDSDGGGDVDGDADGGADAALDAELDAGADAAPRADGGPAPGDGDEGCSCRAAGASQPGPARVLMAAFDLLGTSL